MAHNKEVLVIGGGIAGLTAAQDLTLTGIEVLLIEKEPFIGGHAARLACKATDRCMKCNTCLVEERLKEISQPDLFDVRLGTEVKKIVRKGGGFRISVRSRARLIDPEKCTDCGLCFEKCREAGQGAILMAPSHHLHPLYAIDPLTCTYFKDKEEGICQSICPERAINLDEKQEMYDLDVDGVILATGFEPFDPVEIKRFNFENFKNMVTGMYLEETLRLHGDILRPSDESQPESLAFIQCVGSRDSLLKHDYCSRICCAFALRMALRTVHEHPDIRITLFYMDIQNFGKDFSRYYEEAKDKLRLVRGIPGDFSAADNDRISVNYYDEMTQRTITDDFDMIILSVGMVPSGSHAFFRDMLEISLNEDGFLTVPDEVNGIVVAGSAGGPMDVSESISHAKRAALEMMTFLRDD